MGFIEYETVFGGAPRDIPWADVGFAAGLPIVDVGAGTGASTIALAHALAEPEILALEPGPTARAILLHKVAADDRLRDRITVSDQTLQEARLPSQCAGFVVTGTLYFMSPGQRQEAWQLFADRLPPGGVVLFEDGDAPAPHCAQEEVLIAERSLGRRTYQRWFSQRPLPDSTVEFTNRVVVLENHHEVTRDMESWRSWPLSATDRRAEALAGGLFTVEELVPGRYLVARRREA